MLKLKKSQINELIDKLSFYYSCNLDHLKNYYFYINKNGKIYFSTIDIEELSIDRVNSIGLYFGTMHEGNRFRLSIEGSRFITPKKNYILLDEKSFNSYIVGENLFKDEVKEINWQDKCPFLIVRYNDESLGSANVKDREILCYVPKSRKLDYDKVF